MDLVGFQGTNPSYRKISRNKSHESDVSCPIKPARKVPRNPFVYRYKYSDKSPFKSIPTNWTYLRHEIFFVFTYSVSLRGICTWKRWKTGRERFQFWLILLRTDISITGKKAKHTGFPGVFCKRGPDPIGNVP